jgi:hypothetical protein
MTFVPHTKPVFAGPVVNISSAAQNAIKSALKAGKDGQGIKQKLEALRKKRDDPESSAMTPQQLKQGGSGSSINEEEDNRMAPDDVSNINPGSRACSFETSRYHGA